MYNMCIMVSGSSWDILQGEHTLPEGYGILGALPQVICEYLVQFHGFLK